MTSTTAPPEGFVSHAWKAIVHQIVDVVPDSMACCEFDCNKTSCSYNEWANCPRRLAYVRNLHSASADECADTDTGC